MKPLLTSLLLLISTKLLAIPCFFTVVKDSCWIDYDVTVMVTDGAEGNELLSISIPKGKAWNRQSFQCTPGENFLFKARFKPEIWQGTADRVYVAQHYKVLPAQIKPGEKAWEIPICYPAVFAQVPFPPAVSGPCRCDFKQVDPIPALKN